MNQKPNIEEWEKAFDERDVEGDFYAIDGNGLNDWQSYDIDKIKDFIHQQLQKAREEELNTFIEKQQLLLENNEGRDNFEFYSGYRTALLDIKHLMSKAYHSELDQDK